jgi:mono/diheme cytochrome c family protein
MKLHYVWVAAAVLLVSIAQISAEPRPPASPSSDAATVSTGPGLNQAHDSAAPAGRTTQPVGNVEHGAYLAQHVAMCVECHSGRDEAGTIIEAERFMGGQIPLGPPWASEWASRAPRNRGLPGYTEEEGIRLLTRGAIDRQGRQLKLPMPRFRMTPQDAADIVAFLKSLP